MYSSTKVLTTFSTRTKNRVVFFPTTLESIPEISCLEDGSVSSMPSDKSLCSSSSSDSMSNDLDTTLHSRTSRRGWGSFDSRKTYENLSELNSCDDNGVVDSVITIRPGAGQDQECEEEEENSCLFF